jgi:hypothetical protein
MQSRMEFSDICIRIYIHHFTKIYSITTGLMHIFYQIYTNKYFGMDVAFNQMLGEVARAGIGQAGAGKSWFRDLPVGGKEEVV